MDPGYALLQHIKTVPNLINEDPSITTPKNSSFMDMPWSELSKLISQQRRSSESSIASSSTQDSTIEKEDFSLGNWDSMTGYQDHRHKHSSA
ncbi:hypothetical protein J3Q64DRAFT_1735483 [Phycomyces blakesleeanus]|uniref:Uncharacterized protein n=1 Tax=Phycomyces blakesleeanus TaxID=4837 RepID=A0ABR3B2K3_PHYBL